MRCQPAPPTFVWPTIKLVQNVPAWKLGVNVNVASPRDNKTTARNTHVKAKKTNIFLGTGLGLVVHFILPLTFVVSARALSVACWLYACAVHYRLR